MPFGDGGREGGDSAISTGMPGSPRSWKMQEGSSPRASGGSVALLIPWFQTYDFQNFSSYVSVVLSHKLCGHLQMQPWERNTGANATIQYKLK